ncbi:MAG TPA: hypothetical protein VGU66_16660 [Candidatus Elarobacter sp.]|nr:hypothetical protein [Candidatus Elarobacter sp.]
MYHAVRALSVACIAVFSLAACGGGATVPAAKPGTVVPGNQGRHVRSIPCTPDSDGYCYVLLSHANRHTPCGDGNYSAVNSWHYEVYNSTTDLGEYIHVTTLDCNNETTDTWDPQDPAVQYSDPNLP